MGQARGARECKPDTNDNHLLAYHRTAAPRSNNAAESAAAQLCKNIGTTH